MAIKNFVGNNAGMPLGFNRGNPMPLDSSSIWATLAEAQEYAKNGAVAYVGQILAVNEGEAAKAYIIADEAGSLVEVGAVSEITESDVLAALGFTNAEAGAQLVKGTDGKISWIVPDSITVEGLSTSLESLKADVEKLNGNAETEGSVAYQVAQIVGNADENYNTLVEIADWIKSDSTGAAKMANDISSLKELVGEDSVTSQIEAALKDGENDKFAPASVTEQISALESKVGENSVADAVRDALKVNAAAEGEEPVYEDKYALKAHTHAIADVTGLQDALNGKVESSVTDDLASRLETLENKDNKAIIDAITQDDINNWNAADANLIETIKVNGEAVEIVNKAVDISIPVLAADETSISKSEDGVFSVKAVNINKLYIDDDDELILNGGNASK